MTNLGVSKLYLASLTPALAKPGKGRLSLVAKAHLDNQIAMGNTFTDYPKPAKKSKKVRRVGSNPKPKRNGNGRVVRHRLPAKGDKVFRNSNKVVDDTAERTFPAGSVFVIPKSVNNTTGKAIKVSDTTSCAHCRYSVAWCRCGMPSVRKHDKIYRLEVR